MIEEISPENANTMRDYVLAMTSESNIVITIRRTTFIILINS
jgi:hypothetical protein